jgi:Rhodopirellula transposase DDE domain
LLQDATAGDPVGGLRWTHKATRQLATELTRRGLPVGRTAVARLLRERGYSLRTNRKRLAGTRDPDRDRQFRLLARRRRYFLRRGWPVLSVDCKKKELVGNFKNAGRCWRRRALDVLDHDFPSLAAGRAIPFGVYDIGGNEGYVVVGTSRETPQFAVAALRRWLLEEGWRRCRRGRLAIEADCGGGNGSRSWGWKAGLQGLADEFGLAITVGHFPPSASKWNLIEHRLFSAISKNWAGQPLVSYEAVLKFIRGTTSATGLCCYACLDRRDYPAKVKVPPEEREAIQLQRHKVLPKWNYTIRPRTKPSN